MRQVHGIGTVHGPQRHGVSVQVACKNGRVISLGIWDTAGAERFEALSRMYYNGAKAAVLAFDPCNAKSFEKLKFWVRRRNFATGHSCQRVVCSPISADILRTIYGVVLKPHLPHDYDIGYRSLQSNQCILLVQVAEVRETQPDCRLYIAITKCDQLDEPPSIAEQDTGEPDSSSSSNGEYPNLLHSQSLLSCGLRDLSCRH